MDKKALRIVYMGTPDFAVESLKALVNGGYHVVGVVTMPDKPAGRGQKIQYSAIKDYALQANLPLLQPEKLKDPGFLSALQAWDADLQIVVAFRMLPEVVWDMPRLGTFNLHASLLPQYRGAAPINWAIINGEKETGVTTFFLTHEIDTGKIIFQEKVTIEEIDTAGTLHDKLMYLGAKLVTKTVDALLAGQCNATAQEDLIANVALKNAPKIFKETCQIDWNRSPQEIHNFVRGLNPYPGAWAEMKMPNGEVLVFKIFETEPLQSSSSAPIGQVETDGKTRLTVSASGGCVRLLTIQQAGKRRMSAEEFLRGYR